MQSNKTFRLRILAASSETYPYGMAMTYRLHCYAKGLIESGVHFYVVTPRSKRNNNGKLFLYKNNFEGVGYTILLNKSSFKIKFIKYLLKEINPFLLVLYCIINIRKYDVFWLIKFGVIANIIILPILHLFGKKVVFEVNENPYSTDGSKLTRINWVNKLLRGLTFKIIFPQVDGFIVISENLKLLLSSFITKKTIILKVPILINVERNVDRVSKFTLPTKNQFIFHAGTLSEKKDGIINVFKAYANACKSLGNNFKLDFVLTNKVTLPDTWNRVSKIIKENELEKRILITGYLSNSELDYVMENATLTIINKPYNNQNKYNFPTKIGDYMKCGLPIIVGAKDVELLHYLNNNENAIITEPNDIINISKNIVNLITNDSLRKKLSINGIETAQKHFSYKSHGLRLSLFFKQIIDGKYTIHEPEPNV